jgi:hypothetical protein
MACDSACRAVSAIENELDIYFFLFSLESYPPVTVEDPLVPVEEVVPAEVVPVEVVPVDVPLSLDGTVPKYCLEIASRSVFEPMLADRSLNVASWVTKVVPSIG